MNLSDHRRSRRRRHGRGHRPRRDRGGEVGWSAVRAGPRDRARALPMKTTASDDSSASMSLHLALLIIYSSWSSPSASGRPVTFEAAAHFSLPAAASAQGWCSRRCSLPTSARVDRRRGWSRVPRRHQRLVVGRIRRPRLTRVRRVGGATSLESRQGARFLHDRGLSRVPIRTLACEPWRSRSSGLVRSRSSPAS